MKNKYIYIFFIYIFSCGYPDIDSVPDFKDVNITEEESIDLCKINNSDIDEFRKCLDEFVNNKD